MFPKISNDPMCLTSLNRPSVHFHNWSTKNDGTAGDATESIKLVLQGKVKVWCCSTYASISRASFIGNPSLNA